MSKSNPSIRYDEAFKRTLVYLYQSGGKTQALSVRNAEYHNQLLPDGSYNILPFKDENEILTAKQLKELPRRNAQFEEEIMLL